MQGFAPLAQKIIEQATVEARQRKNYFVDDADILLALLFLAGSDQSIEQLIKDVGITTTYLRLFKEANTLMPAQMLQTAPPWTSNAQNVLLKAQAKAKEFKCDYAGADHLLYGLLKVQGSAVLLLNRSLCGFASAIALKICLRYFKNEGKNYKREIRAHIRWMIRRDMPEVLAIENESFEFPWLEEDFIRCLKQRNCIGMVAEYNDKVPGFMIYELNKTKIHVLNFAVGAGFRRLSVGSQMVAKLINKLSLQRRSHITLEVRETNLAAQQFFRENGFRAVSILRSFFEDTPEDAYLMQHLYQPPKENVSGTENMIARLAG